jgi:hypothetical protein
MIKNKNRALFFNAIMYTGGAIYSFASRLLKIIIPKPAGLVNMNFKNFR